MILKSIARLIAFVILQCATAQTVVASDFDRSFDRALDLAVQNKTTQALALLNKVEANKSVSPDLLHLTKARIYFQTNKLDASIAEYNQIAEKSTYWLTSLDEKAQAFGRKGQYADVIATLQTAMAPIFADRVSPEVYFTAALTDLKICDYAAVFKVTEKFKKQMKPRLANTSDAKSRKEIEDVVNQLQVIEAEVIERISLAERNDNRREQGQIASGPDVLRFKVDDEIWLDELGHYQAQVKECPTLNLVSKTSKKK
jgi:tetratricopeptide (TPR) repeat protein